ncbi:hypothetical protein TNCV_2366961 [Trichonephila clavipes]|nr:hypothetical protein TNCV_2366961 [Trichonephila clavipes]
MLVIDVLSKLLILKGQWSNDSVSRFHIIGTRSFPGLGKADSAFNLYSIGSINEYQACFGSKTLGVSLQTDHLIGTSAHTPQRPMVTYTGMGTVGPGQHGLLRSRV